MFFENKLWWISKYSLYMICTYVETKLTLQQNHNSHIMIDDQGKCPPADPLNAGHKSPSIKITIIWPIMASQ